MADFTSRFNELLARSSGNDTELAAALGVSKQTISAWKNGTRFPKKPALRTIAEHFHVGVPWLNGVSDEETAALDANNIILTVRDPIESELVSIYRDLNSTGKTILVNTARGLSANPDMKKGSESNAETA